MRCFKSAPNKSNLLHATDIALPNLGTIPLAVDNRRDLDLNPRPLFVVQSALGRAELQWNGIELGRGVCVLDSGALVDAYDDEVERDSDNDQHLDSTVSKD